MEYLYLWFEGFSIPLALYLVYGIYRDWAVKRYQSKPEFWSEK